MPALPNVPRCCIFRLCVCRSHHSHGGRRRDSDMQLWCWAVRQAFRMLGTGSRPQEGMCQRGDPVRRDISNRQAVGALRAQGGCWCGRRVADHQAGGGGRLRDVWMPCGDTGLVQRSQAPADSHGGGRWDGRDEMMRWFVAKWVVELREEKRRTTFYTSRLRQRSSRVWDNKHLVWLTLHCLICWCMKWLCITAQFLFCAF